jgi:hypothetical protein
VLREHEQPSGEREESHQSDESDVGDQREVARVDGGDIAPFALTATDAVRRPLGRDPDLADPLADGPGPRTVEHDLPALGPAVDRQKERRSGPHGPGLGSPRRPDEGRGSGHHRSAEQEGRDRRALAPPQPQAEQRDRDHERGADVREEEPERDNAAGDGGGNPAAYADQERDEREQQKCGVRERLVHRAEAAEPIADRAHLNGVRVAELDQSLLPERLLGDSHERDEDSRGHDRDDRPPQHAARLGEQEPDHEQEQRLRDQAKALCPGHVTLEAPADVHEVEPDHEQHHRPDPEVPGLAMPFSRPLDDEHGRRGDGRQRDCVLGRADPGHGEDLDRRDQRKRRDHRRHGEVRECHEARDGEEEERDGYQDAEAERPAETGRGERHGDRQDGADRDKREVCTRKVQRGRPHGRASVLVVVVLVLFRGRIRQNGTDDVGSPPLGLPVECDQAPSRHPPVTDDDEHCVDAG